ncbi:carbohydrate ABC transporter permease [Parasphaerochaeta coccoides]|uniref:Binding-protein-dependent transport systems inner membrane component n=1 Tax=Parasphaerochaeta coccoides (strain ATCC BAA-1237 / DSM 17374 / SPN1) TaxID=760011 RepID=F4GHI4_PARC1|nr:sugar ABC transporter permease [Parasphaerochaeta coccoides]AEC02573.1 binding-protein-dependent transport systems inner membrane component [Parasphaerochaeta coccoides DSM 17374]
MAVKRFTNKKNERIHAYVFIAPFFILFMVFQLYPLIWSFVLSFFSWNGLGTRTFIGIGNYRQILRDGMFWTSLYNTVWYTFANIICVLPLAFILAQGLCSNAVWAPKSVKTLLVLPYVTATVAAGIAFTMLFDTRIGVINAFIQFFGGNAVPWLTSMQWSKVPVALLSIWRNIPWYMLILVAALLSVDRQLYEAARIDGANTMQKIFKITLPMIAPVMFFCVINLTIDSARTFTEPYVLTGGGPGSSSLSVVHYLYINAFSMFKLGYASTVGYVLMFFLVVVSVVYFRNLKNRSGA